MIIADGQALTAGRFNVDAEGTADLTTFEFDPETVAATTKYVLTIEPAENDDPAPSKVHLVAGPFVDGTASLTVDDEAAIGTDFTDASGGFILETPTSESPDDYANGIWWLDPTAGPASAYDLPALPEGWAYEGWVVGADGPVSTGRFATADGADSDGAGPTAGASTRRRSPAKTSSTRRSPSSGTRRCSASSPSRTTVPTPSPSSHSSR